MKNKLKRTTLIICMVSVFAGSFIYPEHAYAKVSFNRFFRNMGRVARSVGRGSRFVINLPDKATRWMGPVLGPIASTILTRNISNHSKWGDVFRQAGRASRVYDSIEEKEKYLATLRTAYHSQANDLRNQANSIRDSRANLQDKLTTGEITYADYRNHVLALEDIADAYETAADKFDASADRMKMDDVVRIFSGDFINQVLGQVKNAVISETTKDINRFIDPQIIKDIIGGKSVNFDTFLDSLTSHQIDRYLGDNEGKFDVDELKERVRNRIKEIMEESKDEFKRNWREKLDEIIKNMVNELEDEKKNLPQVEEEEKAENADGDEAKNERSVESSDDKCPNGYQWDIQIGKCIQSNCFPEQIPNAHYSYVKDCICGSSGSINENPKDPNKVCRKPGDDKSCPNCVYACVHSGEECPNASGQ